MKLLKTISDTTIPDQLTNQRKAARAVLFDENNLVPILFVSKHNYHKLPGGGIEEGEDIKTALTREIQEEVGCEAEILQEVGKIIEYRSQRDLYQTSYCFIGKITKKGKPDFTKSELEQGFQIQRHTLNETIELLKKDQPNNYEGKFIQERDLELLKETQKLITQHCHSGLDQESTKHN